MVYEDWLTLEESGDCCGITAIHADHRWYRHSDFNVDEAVEYLNGAMKDNSPYRTLFQAVAIVYFSPEQRELYRSDSQLQRAQSEGSFAKVLIACRFDCVQVWENGNTDNILHLYLLKQD